MLLDLIRSGFNRDIVIQLLLSVPIILFSLTLHEFSHGFVAYKMGDPTARNFGRLTLNPIKHIDPVGAGLMLVFGFGWAKPVPINSRYFKNPKWGMAISAAAGPLSNLLLSFVSYNISYLLATKIDPFRLSYTAYNVVYIVILFFYLAAFMNATLAVFNLIPIPPLDGSRLLFTFLPQRLYFAFMRYEQIIMTILMVGVFFGAFSNVISNVTGFILTGFDKFAQLVFG